MKTNLIAMYLLTDMQNKGVTYDALAAMTNIPKSSIQRNLTGDRELPMDRFELICRALNLDPAHVLGWDTKDEEEDELNKQIVSIISGLSPAEKSLAIEVLKRFAGVQES